MKHCPQHPDRPWKPWSKIGCSECQTEHARKLVNERKREYRKRHNVEATPAAKARKARYNKSEKRKVTQRKYSKSDKARARQRRWESTSGTRICICGCGKNTETRNKILTAECARRRKLERLAAYKKTVKKERAVRLCSCGCGREAPGQKQFTEKCAKRIKSEKAKKMYAARKKPVVRERPFATPIVKKAQVDLTPLPVAPEALLKKAEMERTTLRWGRWE